ncbi:MAG: hypothetical protein IJL92_09880 [Thermoguttaceae bacterium]|nr:hypothetical protein [Thermoguttaceae bacterium]
MKKTTDVCFILAVAFAALVGGYQPLARADYQDWAFDDAAFQARLRDDWLTHDAATVESNGPLFAERDDATPEKRLVEQTLDQIREYDEDAAEPFAARLAALVDAKTHANDPKWRALYYDACQVRRKLRLADAIELAPRFVYTKHYVLGASHYAYTEDVSDEAYKDFSANRQPGGQLCLATFAEDGSIRHEVLLETPDGTIRDPEVSWDGREIVFSMRRSFTEDDFHLYVYNLETRETRQLTFGLGVADVEPAWLPNGDVIFISTRCGQNIDCWWTEVSNLYTCDAQGRYLRRLGMDQVTVNYPKVLDDGRVVYTRWEYNDRGHVYVQPLFQMNSDGTGQTEYYGNNSIFPTSLLHSRGVPGTNLVISIASGHHTYQQGALVVVDRSKGTQRNEGITLVAPGRPQPEDVMVDRYAQDGELFAHPFALDDANILVSYLPEGSHDRAYDVPFGVYWFDFDGARELLAYDPAISCGQAAPLVAREVPTVRPSQVDLSKKTGLYYVQDVYEGPGLKGIERGVVKKLRVVELLYRPFSVGWNWNWGEVGDSLVSGPCAVNNGSWDAKRVIGEVPVEEDGSAYFEVPALTPVYFQLLDANGDVVQTMRSWSTLQPGETFGCVGCHEPKGSIVENATNAAAGTSIALLKGVAIPAPVLTPPPGVHHDDGFDYVRDIQPILDHNCVSCHTGREGDAFSLLGNEEKEPVEERKEIYQEEKRRFSESYLTLTQNGRHEGRWVRWLGTQDPPYLLEPYHWGAAKSPLITMFRGPDGHAAGQDEFHRDVKLDDRSLKTLAMWIDLLVPYCGDYYEHNRWTNGERAYYRYYNKQRELNAAIVKKNVAMKLEAERTGVDFPLEAFPQFSFGGPEARKTYVSKLLDLRAPSLAWKTGDENVYRNLAVNPYDRQTDRMGVVVYPHASSNSEYAFADAFAAKNAIDGKKENRGHGDRFPSWGPNLRTDLWLNVDFGCDVDVDKCVIWLRADYPHDGAWKSATLEFSDGSTEKIQLKATAEPQTFAFPERRVNWIRMTDLEVEYPLKWCGITEIEFWGKTAVEER